MSDRDKDPHVDEAVESAATAPSGKPRRNRRSTAKAAPPKNDVVRQATKDMIAEGGPVGDEIARQLGVTLSPEEEAALSETPAPVPKTSKSKTPKDEVVAEESAEMISEGGPVGDEIARQHGVTDLPPEEVEQETAIIEKAHPELTGGARPAKSSGEDTEPKTKTISVKSSAPRRRKSSKPEPPSTSDPLIPGTGNPSPDGTQLAYLLTDATGSTRLWISALDGTSASSIELPFEPVFELDGPQWSPDGVWIALTGSAPSGIGTAIWLAPADGGDCVLLADHIASDDQPRWSPDGSLLAFSSKRHGRSAICVATPDGYGPVVQLTDGPLGQDDRNPCWEPTSQRIAYTRHTVDGENDGEHIWTVSILSGEQKQATKKLAHRSQLQWCPGKSQIAFITDEAEWLNVGVVNPDNSAGWNLASESGDKSFPRYSPDGQRIMYIRRVRGETRLVERPTSGASADPLDPGSGVAAAPGWLPDKRVVYQFSSITEAPAFIVQEAKQDVDRLFIPVAGDWTPRDSFVIPEHQEYEISGGLKSGLLIYRTKSDKAQPGVVLLGSNPHRAVRYEYDSMTQALAQHGFTVIVPTLPGTPGYGKKLIKLLKERAGTEAEISDLVDLTNWMRNQDFIDSSRIYLVGQGYGGALALLLPGARPGSVDAVAVIDPVTDWDDELDQADDEFAHWYLNWLGLPSVNRGKSALRTPTTFAGVLDLPLLLIGTSGASMGRAIQLERYAVALEELEVPYIRELAERESTWSIAEHVAAFLTNPEKPVIEPKAVSTESAGESEPDFTIEPVETVDIETLLIGKPEEVPQNGVERPVEDIGPTPEEANSGEPITPQPAESSAEAAEVDPEDRVIPPPPQPVSSNVGRGMRTDEI